MAAITPHSSNTPSIQQTQSKTAKFIPSTTLIRITSAVLLTLAILAVVGSCAALILTTNLWFLLLSAAGGLCLSLGIIVNFTFPTKKEGKQIC
ncbi:hypothetical protein [Chlamydia caviae]|uniref:Uncharacterized protein n=1 Tax=Chlamydia caviae (strain ATCC VR-813 / DSM 19441 / 03DC25 / GPIC) TaxID=227941 RepID=Q823I0_CHLCV|nr:hypothetical protein [Chlamydia caviae]AAP05176.1 hypothetical protein CCA_00430 [Chlamydia caviae GPIC]